MPLIVQKYGGTSVASPERVRAIAAGILRHREQGVRLVAVVSAMGDTTDRLLDLAGAVASGRASPRELDQLLATGEQVAAALLALALTALGVPAVSLTGDQAGILTGGDHGAARIRQIRTQRVQRALAKGAVPIVTGFQGRGPGRSVYTLGRGGSDTSAIALAVALGAERCDIYTDVPGIFTADPRVVPAARVHARLAHQDAVLLALAGAIVLHPRAATMAAANRMPVRILSSLEPDTGSHTDIEGEAIMEEPRLLGVTVTDTVVHLAVELPGSGGMRAAAVLGALTAAGLSVQSLSQAIHDGAMRFSVRVVASDGHAARRLAEDALEDDARVLLLPPLSRVCLVGRGLSDTPAVLQAALGALANERVVVEAVESTDLGLSLYIDPARVELAARALHDRLLTSPADPDNRVSRAASNDGVMDTPLAARAGGAG